MIRVAAPMIGAAALVVGCSSSNETGGAAPPTTAGTVPAAFVDANDADLTGTWTSSERHYDIRGERGTGSETMTITDLDNGLFKVSRSIEVAVPADFGDGTDTTTATFDGVGVVNPDGTFTLVKSGDSGLLTGWLTGPDEMETVYVESGDEQVVVRQTLQRS